MQPRRLFCPLRGECWFQVTNSGYSSRALDVPELSDVFDEAGVALPLELELEPEPIVEGRELSLLPADPVFLLSSLEIAAGRAGPSDSVSTSVICSSSAAAALLDAPGSAGFSLLLLLLWYFSHNSSTCDRLKGCLFSNCALKVSKQNAQCAVAAMVNVSVVLPIK